MSALPTVPTLFLEKISLQRPGITQRQFMRRTARITSQLGRTRKTKRDRPKVWMPSRKKDMRMSVTEGPLRLRKRLWAMDSMKTKI